MSRPIVVIKIGGNEFSDPAFLPGLVEAVRALGAGACPVLVHGGGRAIDALMEKVGIEPVFVNGQRATDEAALEIAEMVLSGGINKTLVLALLEAGLDAAGMSGVDRGLIRVEAWSEAMPRVGRIRAVRAEVLRELCAGSVIPVISPISHGMGGKYNVNADHAAGAVAGALGAERVIFVSNVPGVLLEGRCAPELSGERVRVHLESGAIRGGMVPKVNAALDALSFGVGAAVITDLAGLRDGAGTVIFEERKSGGKI